MALVAVSVPTVWFVTRGGVTVEQAAVERSAPPTAEPQEPQEASFWSPSATVKAASRADRTPVELGMRFTAAQNGWVAGVRFYKARGDKGKHTGSLWTAGGKRLASVTFTGESGSGWQEARFASPVRLRAKQLYTVSYHSADGNYVGSKGFDSVRSGPLTTTPRDAGVFGYGKSGFPSRSNPKGYNYWVDVIFRWRNRHPTPRPTWSPEPSRSPSVTPTPGSDETPEPSRTPDPSQTAAPSVTPTSDQTSSPTVTPTSDQTSSPSPSTTGTTRPTHDPSPSPTKTTRPTHDPSPTDGPDPSTTPTPLPTRTATPTPTPSGTATQTPAPTKSGDPSPSPTRTATSKPTFSPRPTLSPDPGGGGCAGYPTPACTGVPPGTKLSMKALNEDGAAYRVTTPGTVLDGVHITGDLLVHADNVVIRNSEIDGRVINADGPATFRFTITDSTIGPAKGCQTLPGIGQDKYTARRVHIRNHGDGFRASGDDIVIEDSYVHLCSNPQDHSDGIQTYNTGRGLTFNHNTVDQRDATDITAPIFLVDKQIVDAVITNNLVMGGTYSIQLKNGRGNLVMRGNKLVDKSWAYGPVEADCAKIDWADNSLVTIDGNYRITSTVGPLPCKG